MSKHSCQAGEYALHLHIRKLPEGPYLATSKQIPDLLAQGNSVEETIAFARDVACKLIESYREHGDPLPADLKPVRKRMEVDTAIAL